MPTDVKTIISILEEHGYEAYAVGGCVRDSLLGKEPKDWDITTSAKPEQVKELFHKTLDTGIQHGTVTVMMHHVGYEVTTYRIDGKYEDGRHPKEVIFTPSLEEDLKRRDFTINAMAYSDRTGIVDKFHGMEDLQNKVIRCVGIATERFLEDALRILRAVRFSAQLGFQIDQETMVAVTELAPTLKKISRERIQTELDKLLLSPHPDRVIMLEKTGLLQEIFADCEKEENSAGNAMEELAEKLGKTEPDHYLRWSLFLSYVPYRRLLKSLKFDNKTIHICEKYKAFQAEKLQKDKPYLRRLIVKIGKDIFEGYLRYREILGNVDTETFLEVQQNWKEIVENGDCLSIRELVVNGKDLKEAGVESGVRMGEILNALFDLVLEDASANRRETLLEEVKKLL